MDMKTVAGEGDERKGNILTFSKGYQKNCWIKISVFLFHRKNIDTGT